MTRNRHLLYNRKCESYDAVSCALDAPGAVSFDGVIFGVVRAEEFPFGLSQLATTFHIFRCEYNVYQYINTIHLDLVVFKTFHKS